MSATTQSNSLVYKQRVETVIQTEGCIAFWDFVKREKVEPFRFISHIPGDSLNYYALEASNYIKTYWGEGREATYSDFPLLGYGPFGQAVGFRYEKDISFRPLLNVPRKVLHDTPLDIKGENRSVTVIVWVVRESGNHGLAGIWHEGIDRPWRGKMPNLIEKGQRQYGLFAGLNREGAACAHVSENGIGSFGYIYALHRTLTPDVSVKVDAGSSRNVLDKNWSCYAMTFDNDKDEIKSWINGKAGRYWESAEDRGMTVVRNAWRQAKWHNMPGIQEGEDPGFPKDQYYEPPEKKPVSTYLLEESDEGRIELWEYPYSQVKVVIKGDRIVEKDLMRISRNPWWYPHGIYQPEDHENGGPFTIGRVIHNAADVGFTGWIGGVAVYNRALSEKEIEVLSKITHLPTISK